MSAIVGRYHFQDDPVTPEECRNMMKVLEKYPSDAIHFWADGPIFLGCLAKWITPESMNETLPNYDAVTDMAITADAIIDNRKELFDRLQVEFDRRRDMTDSELILLAYRKWGEDAPKYFVGDFTFMIWDKKKRLLFGARDTFGMRTLYYHHDHKSFTFCTAVSPLFSAPNIEKRLNEVWMAEFLAIPTMFDTTSVTTTVYDSISQVPPAHIIKVENGIVKLSQYDAVVPGGQLRLKSDADYVEAFRDVFQQAVNSKIRTFRKVGATLSGGLDSGSVVSFAAKSLKKEGKSLHTYSAVPVQDFADWSGRGMMADESPYIQSTVNHIGGLTHHYMRFPGKDPLSEVNDWIDLLETPYKFFENSVYIRGIHEEAQRHGIGVLLTGAKGNNTISWGYAPEYYFSLLKKLRWVRFYREMALFAGRLEVRRTRLLKGILKKYAVPRAVRTLFSASEFIPDIPQLVNPDFAARNRIFDKLENQPYDVGLSESSMNSMQQRAEYFQNLSIMSMVGTVSSKLSLRYGLVERDPTSDLRVARFCLSLPIEQFVQNGMDRALIRRSTKGDLPDAVRLNHKVRGLQSADWAHRMTSTWKIFHEELRRLCQDRMAAEYLNIPQIKESMHKIGEYPKPQYAIDRDVRGLMRGLIAYRFLEKLLK